MYIKKQKKIKRNEKKQQGKKFTYNPRFGLYAKIKNK